MVSLLLIGNGFPSRAVTYRFEVVSAREIIEQLPRLTADELQAVEQRISELISGKKIVANAASYGRVLRPERVDGRLVLTGSGLVRQAEVDAVLDEFP